MITKLESLFLQATHDKIAPARRFAEAVDRSIEIGMRDAQLDQAAACGVQILRGWIHRGNCLRAWRWVVPLYGTRNDR